MVEENRWELLHNCAELAPGRTHIPRVPLIPQELHTVAWEVYGCCRYISRNMAIDNLRDRARTAPESQLREFYSWVVPNGYCIALRVQVQRLFGLWQW